MKTHYTTIRLNFALFLHQYSKELSITRAKTKFLGIDSILGRRVPQKGEEEQIRMGKKKGGGGDLIRNKKGHPETFRIYRQLSTQKPLF